MPITIVSALPKSAPPSTANVAAGTENTNSGQDFTSLLLGQLATAQQGAGLILGTASEPAANDSVGASLDEENADSGDPLALLAVLAQASLEQRGQVALDTASMGNKSSSPAGATSLLDENISPSERMTQNTTQALSSDLLTPANEQAAKFAVFPDKMSGKNASNTQEPAGLSAMGASVTAAGIHSRQDASPAAPIPVPTSVYDRNWGNDFAQKVTWIATHHGQSAELTLNPPSMGSIEVSIKIDNDKSTATATFVSSSAEVRETIETSLPRLREMLAGVGIELGQAQVSAESFRQASDNGQPPGEGASPSGNDMTILAPDSQVAQTAASVVGSGHGLVDMFV
jgi:flagellar hook-length control protein FliK